MAKLHHVKNAKKARPEHNIEVGDEYWWWKHYGREKQCSKVRPTRKQLTTSEYLRQVYNWIDDMPNFESLSDLEAHNDNFVLELDSIADDYQGRLDSMPDHLQTTAPSAILLTNRIELLQDISSELQSFSFEREDEDLEEVIDEYREIVQRLEEG
jgi:hypothetical protein